MFENILGFWKGKDFLTQVIDDFKSMLDDTEKMYGLIQEALLHDSQDPNLKEQIYTLDKNVNRNEKKIRKRIIEHLSLQPKVETSWCLCVMSVVKDAERVGDYCKNLYEVKTYLDKPIDKDLFNSYFNSIDLDLMEMFKGTRDAFIDSDNEKASSTWETKTKIGNRCDDTLQKLAKSDLPTNQAVCYTLIARHFKRISSHLVNIATSVVLPVSDLDYYDEDTTTE